MYVYLERLTNEFNKMLTQFGSRKSRLQIAVKIFFNWIQNIDFNVIIIKHEQTKAKNFIVPVK